MDKVQKNSNPDCNIQSSETFRIYMQLTWVDVSLFAGGFLDPSVLINTYETNLNALDSKSRPVA
jgi:hypothetical protein